MVWTISSVNLCWGGDSYLWVISSSGGHTFQSQHILILVVCLVMVAVSYLHNERDTVVRVIHSIGCRERGRREGRGMEGAGEGRKERGRKEEEKEEEISKAIPDYISPYLPQGGPANSLSLAREE